MEKYELTDKDYTDLRELFVITTKIKLIYDRLSELESANKKYDLEYKNLINSLNLILEQEQKILKKIGTNPKKISELLFYILKYEQISLNDCLDFIYKNLVNEVITARIVIHFERILNNADYEIEDDEFDNECEEYEYDDEASDDLSRMENVEAQFKYMNDLDEEFQKDFLNTLLKILNEYIFNPEYTKISSGLINYKYLLSFVFKPIEKDMLANNFEINSILYWSSKMIVDLNGGHKEDLEVLKSSYADDILFQQSDYLIDLFFENLDVLDNYKKAIICQILIRTCLLFCAGRTKITFINFLMDELKTSDFCNKDVEEIIVNSLNKIEQDRTFPNIISLKLD